MISEADPATGRRHSMQAFDAVDRGLTCVTFSLHVAHPDTGCLPLPELRSPRSIGELETYAERIEAGLWRDAHNWAPAWTRILSGCTHGLDPYGVSTVFGLIHAWRALISRAADHAAQRQSSDAYSLDGRLILLAQAGQKAASLRAGHHG